MKKLLFFLTLSVSFFGFSQVAFADVSDFDVWTFSSDDLLTSHNYDYTFDTGSARTFPSDLFDDVGYYSLTKQVALASEVVDIPLFDTDSGFSVSFWVKPNAYNHTFWVLPGFNNVDGDDRYVQLKLACASGNEGLHVDSWSTDPNVIGNAGCSATTGTNQEGHYCYYDDWNLVVISIEEGQTLVYINNVLMQTCSHNQSCDFTSTGYLNGIGYYSDDDSPYIDVTDVSLFDTILTSDERDALWNAGSGASVLDVFGSGGDPVSYDDPSDLEDYWYCYAGDVISGIDNEADCLAENTYPGLAIDEAIWIKTTSTCHEYVCGYFEAPQYSPTDIFEVDLDSQLTDFTTQFECEANGGYWWIFPPPDEGCYELVPVSAWSDVSHLFFGWDPSSYASSSPDMVSWLDVNVTTSTPAKILEAPNKWLSLIAHRFPFNVVSQYILFWYKMLDAVQSNNSSINYYSYSSDISFFPGQEEAQNYTLMDFNQPGLSDTPITLLGLNFSSFYSFCRLFFKFFLYLAFGAYCLKFGTRLFSNN
jgi:hypothetical protein